MDDPLMYPVQVEGESYTGIAYSGGVYSEGDVIDLSGLTFAPRTRVLCAHRTGIDSTFGALTEEPVIDPGGVLVTFTRNSNAAIPSLAAEMAGEGFEWGLSLGFDFNPEETHFAELGEIVNGRPVPPGTFVYEKAMAREVSLTPVPSDAHAYAVRTKGSIPMSVRSGKTMHKGLSVNTGAPARESGGPLEGHEASIRREAVRVVEIQRLCAGNPEVEKEAIHGGWSVLETRGRLSELAEKNAELPRVHAVPRNAREHGRLTVDVLSAALAKRARPSREAKTEAEREAAERWRGGLGIQGIIKACHPDIGEIRDAGDVRRALNVVRHAGGASTLPDVGTVLQMTLSKFIQDNTPAMRRDFERVGKERDVGQLMYEVVAARTRSRFEKTNNDEQIHRSSPSVAREEAKLTHYSDSFEITQDDVINDEIGMLTDFAPQFVAGSIDLRNRVTFDALNNYTGFTGDRAMTLDLNSMNLEMVCALFEELTYPNGTLVGRPAAILAVPTGLWTTAAGILRSAQLNVEVGNGATQWRAPILPQLELVATPFLPNTAPLSWYLMADKEVLPTIDAAYLRGQREPVVETFVDPDPERYVAFMQRAGIYYGAKVIDTVGAMKFTQTA